MFGPLLELFRAFGDELIASESHEANRAGRLDTNTKALRTIPIKISHRDHAHGASGRNSRINWVDLPDRLAA